MPHFFLFLLLLSLLLPFLPPPLLPAAVPPIRWEVGHHHGGAGAGSSVTVDGEPQLKYPGEHHNRPFEVLLLTCDFQQAIQTK